MKLINKQAAEPQKFTLKCDRADVSAGEQKAVFTLKPLTRDIVDTCATKAGKVPWNGRRVADALSRAVNTAGTDFISNFVKELEEEADSSGKTFLKPSNSSAIDLMSTKQRLDFLVARANAEYAFMSGLDEAELGELLAANKWVTRHERLMAGAIVVDVDGEIYEDFEDLLSKIRPDSLVDTVVKELIDIGSSLANLDDEKKDGFARRYGSTTTTGVEGGTAPSVMPAPGPTKSEESAAEN